MADAPLIRVMLVDDQELIRTGFRMILEGEPDLEVVGEAGDGAASLDLIASLESSHRTPDVVLMDVRMPRLNGIEATQQIVAKYPHVKVLLLTTFDLDEYAFSGLAAGASGFLVKDTKPAVLTGAIRDVASGDAVVSPRVTRRLLDTFAPTLPAAAQQAAADKSEDSPTPPSIGALAASSSARSGAGSTPSEDSRISHLTPRELEVLGLIGQGLSNSEIAQTLFVSETTVKTHVGSILAKTGCRDRVHAVILAYQTGINN